MLRGGSVAAATFRPKRYPPLPRRLPCAVAQHGEFTAEKESIRVHLNRLFPPAPVPPSVPTTAGCDEISGASYGCAPQPRTSTGAPRIGTRDATLFDMFVFDPVCWLLALVFAFAFVGLDRLVRWIAQHARSSSAPRQASPASPDGAHFGA